MSTLLSHARSRMLRQVENWPRPHLTVVPKATTRLRRIPFVFVVVGILALGLIGLLVLNTTLQQGTYAVSNLRDRASALQDRQQHLQVQVAQLQSPQRLAEQALRLGMVDGGSPAFLSLATGQIVGHPTPGAKGNRPVVTQTATATGAVRASKPMPVVAGTHNSGSTGVVTHQPAKRFNDTPPHSQKRGDTPDRNDLRR